MPIESNTSELSQVNQALGQKLKTLREAFGLSQRELAKRAGVTNSNISMIEQGQISPSVQSLTRILDVFPMTLAEFFSCDLLVSQSPVISGRSIKSYVNPEGIKVCHLRADSRVPEITRQVFPVASSGQLQAANRDQIGWVLSGELQLQLGTQYFLITTGDAFHIHEGQVFCFANHHTKEAEILIATNHESR